MKKINWENLYVLIAALIVNKFLLFGLISTTNRTLAMSFFIMIILNFLVAARFIDKMIQKYEQSKEKMNKTVLEMPIN